MKETPDLRQLHRRALNQAGDLVRTVGTADLTRPSPCAGWDLAALLTHVIGQHHGFARAIRDGDAPVSAYTGPAVPDADALPVLWAESARALTEAMAAAAPDQRVRLVEFGPEAVFPADTVVGFHLLDTTVHAWDVAAALGRPEFRPDDELVAATAEQAARVPGGEARARPGAAFGPELTVGEGDPWAAVLARLGRRALP